MSKVKKSLATVAATLSLFGSGVVVASPAHAATGFDRCPHGSFCLFSDSSGRGTIGIFQDGSSDLRLQGLDNDVHAIWNRSGQDVTTFPGYNYTGHALGHYSAYGDPKVITAYSANRISSAQQV